MAKVYARVRLFCFRRADDVLSWAAGHIVWFINLLPLSIVSRLGRAAGECFYWIDSRHRQVALENLTRCFEREKSAEQIHWIARENFRRLGESFASGLKMALMPTQALWKHVEISGTAELTASNAHGPPRTRIVAFGHFGNFELLARMNQLLPPYRGVTTYRGLKYPRLEQLLTSLRERSGCQLFERRTGSARLRACVREPGVMLGLAADQHARGGVRLPLFGWECSTSVAPAVFALRFGHPLHTAICYRLGLGRWRIEFSKEIPTRCDGQRRSVEAIMLDINRSFEEAIRRDPANWFWVHKRWKPANQKSLPQAHLLSGMRSGFEGGSLESFISTQTAR